MPAMAAAIAARAAIAAAVSPIATVAATIPARLTRFLRRQAGCFAKENLARQFDAVLVVDGDDLDLDAVADFADGVDALDVLVVEFADMTQPIATGQDFDERAKILNRRDAAIV